ncbi:MAG TPA: ABC transporter ATP-binding protein/permease [Candidatus Olsenella excrementavium]|uniref:ABC transporter ATP-binding protein/permease n=1 Tax=Candidatus Olsenella excrementavium TaxID=2838709 RepID=A0A9D2CHF0_9ACTN|nr:ABC transporter ATP-binding protein/permease [Candidatus Olsenella excrementavium]
MGSIRQYKGAAIATPLLVLGEVVFEVLIPLLTADLIDAIKAGADLSQILSTGGLLALMALVSLGFGAAAGLTCAKASVGFAKNLRKDMFYNIQTFSFAVIDRFSSSSLVTRLTTDVMNVQMAYMMLIRTAIRSPFMLVGAFIAAYTMAGWLAVVFVVVIPVLAVALLAVVRKVMPIFRRIFRKYDALNERAEENLSGIRVVKSYVREDYEKQKYDAAASEVQRDFTYAERILALNAPIMNFCVYTVMVFVIYVGSYAIVSTRGELLDVGQFSSLITYGFMMLMSLMMLSMIFAMVVMSEENARRIFEVLDARTTIEQPTEPVYEVADGSIDFDHVGFSYKGDKDHEALREVDLHIRSGEVIGVIGSTGSAKSTLVQLIPRLYDVTEGTVRVGGVDVRDYDLDTLRNAVAMVLQKNVLFSGTIKDNLRWGKQDATDDEILEAARLAQADEFVQTFPDKYDTHIEQGGTNVSGGQKQRLCIARALLKHPKILILDDSTSAVDTKTDKLIREGLKTYLPEATKIIIAQRTSSVEDADRIVVMDSGRINDVGTHEELLRRNAIYREVYLSQNKQSHDEKNLDELEVSENGR